LRTWNPFIQHFQASTIGRDAHHGKNLTHSKPIFNSILENANI